MRLLASKFMSRYGKRWEGGQRTLFLDEWRISRREIGRAPPKNKGARPWNIILDNVLNIVLKIYAERCAQNNILHYIRLSACFSAIYYIILVQLPDVLHQPKQLEIIELTWSPSKRKRNGSPVGWQIDARTCCISQSNLIDRIEARNW